MATKKAAKKAPAKRVVAKKSAKKAVAKKSAKKVVAKKAAKKAPAKKVAKKVTKKAPAKKVAKRSTKKATTSRAAAAVLIPPVPVGNTKSSAAVNVDTKPVAAVAPARTTAPVAKKSSSNRVVLAVVVGILAIGAIVLSKNSSDSNTPAPAPTSDASASASPSTEASSNSTVTTTAAPLGIVAHYTATGATIFWNKSTATDGIKGYSVEISSNGGTFSELAMVSPDVTKYDITKSDTTGWSSFKISTVYEDGQKAAGKVFGLPGQYN